MMAFDTLHVHALARYNMSKGFDVFICTNNRIETEKCHENIKWKNSTNSVIVKQTINQCSFREKNGRPIDDGRTNASENSPTSVNIVYGVPLMNSSDSTGGK